VSPGALGGGGAAPVVWALVFLIGAVIGSFLNVCIARWPMDLSVVAPRSRCPRCQRPIAWYENIPLVSYVALRGRCRGCRQRISAQYPAVELVIALGWTAAFVGFSDPFLALRVAVFGTVLAGVAVTDVKHYVIPDGFTVFGFVWVLATSAAAAFLDNGGSAGRLFVPPYEALIGACVGAGAISIIGWLGEVALKKEAMGFGDVTLMAVVGAAVGPSRALLTVFVGAAIGALVFPLVVIPIARVRSRRSGSGEAREFTLPLVPFGVFLAPAAMVTLLWGDRLIAWYLKRMGLI
jgi:leader peptidase (prepilin peptidase)/N-methyltransferase